MRRWIPFRDLCACARNNFPLGDFLASCGCACECCLLSAHTEVLHQCSLVNLFVSFFLLCCWYEVLVHVWSYPSFVFVCLCSDQFCRHPFLYPGMLQILASVLRSCNKTCISRCLYGISSPCIVWMSFLPRFVAWQGPLQSWQGLLLLCILFRMYHGNSSAVSFHACLKNPRTLFCVDLWRVCQSRSHWLFPAPCRCSMFSVLESNEIISNLSFLRCGLSGKFVSFCAVSSFSSPARYLGVH